MAAKPKRERKSNGESNAAPTRSRDGTRRGGKRAGAGRKTSEERQARSDFNAAANEQLIEWLPDILGNLKRLADGGYSRVEEKFQPAPTAEDPAAMSLVERKVSTADPDRMANQYLLDRLLGRPFDANPEKAVDGDGAYDIDLSAPEGDPA